MVVIYFYLERENYKDLKFHVNSLSRLRNKCRPVISAAPLSFEIKKAPGALIRGNKVFIYSLYKVCNKKQIQ